LSKKVSISFYLHGKQAHKRAEDLTHSFHFIGRQEDEGRVIDKKKTVGKQKRWWEKYSGDKAILLDYGLRNLSGIQYCQETGMERTWNVERTWHKMLILIHLIQWSFWPDLIIVHDTKLKKTS